MSSSRSLGPLLTEYSHIQMLTQMLLNLVQKFNSKNASCLSAMPAGDKQNS